MEIKIERTAEQVELVKAMASKNREVAYEAQAALGDFIGPVLAEVIAQAPTLSNLFTSLQFNSEDNASIPLDLYHDITDEDYIQIWAQNAPGGLPTNQVAPVQQELKFTTYKLDSALSFDKRYAARSRMDVVSKTFTRMAQEILLKQDKTSASIILSALGNAVTNGYSHVVPSVQNDRFLLADLNKLFTLCKRIATSWAGGTPADRRGRGITDLIVSPEIVEEIRGMAYNPINTVSNVTHSDGAGGVVKGGGDIAGTEALRERVFNSAGIPEFYGVSIMEIHEMGIDQKWNKLFKNVSADHITSSATGAPSGITNLSGNLGFDDSKDEVIIGVDLSRESMIRAVATDSESGSEFDLVVDDQFVSRSQKIGYYGSLEEGRMLLDDRVLTGIIV